MKTASTLLLLIICTTGIAQLSNSLKLSGQSLYDLLKLNESKEIVLSSEAKKILTQGIPELADFQLAGIIKHKNNYLLYENGSGQLWHLNNSGKLERWDNTKYAGDRFGAFEFSHNDTVFSIGGYGFWRVSGAVRYFNVQTRDWMILPTNKNVGVAAGVNAIFFHSANTSKVYLIYSHYNDEYLKEEHKKKTVTVYLQIFDLIHKTWAEQPKVLSQSIAKELNDIRVMATTPNALYLNSKYNDQTLEIDFKNNMCSEMEPGFLNDLQQILGQRPVHMIQASDDSIFITDIHSQETYTFNTNKYTKKKIGVAYTNLSSQSNWLSLNMLLYISIGLNILLGAAWVKSKFKEMKWNKKVGELNEIDSPTKGKKFIDFLDTVELNIITNLSEHFKAGKHTSIDEINKILGIEKRPYKIANNIRADILKMINKKFMDFSGNTDELIIRERSAFDKRFFEYTLNQRYINKV